MSPNNEHLNLKLAKYLGITVTETIENKVYGYVKHPNCLNVTGVIDFTKDANLLMQVFHRVTAPQLTYKEFTQSLAENLLITLQEQTNEPT